MFRSVIFTAIFLVISITTVAQNAKSDDTPASFQGELAKGHGLYEKGKYEKALKAYQSAKEMVPGDPLSYYFIGWTQARLARYDDAIVTLRTATTMAGDKDPVLYAKGLFSIAVVEELRYQLDAAQAAWRAYKEYAQTQSKAGSFVATADARLAAIKKQQALDKKYAAVRERINQSK
ncbi:MAG: hypothetical protein QNJ97_24410 [Myxococcota bacterium]|nr:hypothetical protein [Myxococcota bacterium]